MMPLLYCQKLSLDATIPHRATAEAAGFDMFAAKAGIVPAMGRATFITDIVLLPPKNTYIRLASRSSLATVYSIHVAAGVVDRDYRGNIQIVLLNHSTRDFHVAKGDCIAQAIIEKIVIADVLVVQELPATARGKGGFGSTDIKRRRLNEDGNAGACSSSGGNARGAIDTDDEGGAGVA